MAGNKPTGKPRDEWDEVAERGLSKHSRPAPKKPWGIVERICYFRHHYPGDWSRPEYKTDDKIIPYQLFDLMMVGAKGNMAVDKLNSYEASLIANARVHSKESDSFQKVVDSWEKETQWQG